jgi:hypothetical protein
MEYNISIDNLDLKSYINNNIKNENINEFLNQLLTMGFNQFLKQNNKTDNILLDTINYRMLDIKNEIQKNTLLLEKNTNKGNIGEKIIFTYLQNLNYPIEDTSEIAHSADMKVYIPDIKQSILIEVKNYKSIVDQKQVDKFYYDLNFTGIEYGIFISLHSKIANVTFPIEWKIINSKLIIFISEFKEEYLKIALYTLNYLYKNKTKNNNYIKINNYNELLDDIIYLSNQQSNINKIKNDILEYHNTSSKQILSFYNTLCIFDNNFKYSINKICNRLELINNKNTNNDIYLELLDINKKHKDLLEMIISDLSKEDITINSDIKNNKLIIQKFDKHILDIKILKTNINIIIDGDLEFKNITINNWNKVYNYFINTLY